MPTVTDRTDSIAYYYCKYTRAETEKSTSILRSIASQIVRTFPDPESGPAMQLFTACDEGNVAPLLNSLVNTIIELIKMLHTVYICVNALDECTHETQLELSEQLRKITEESPNAKILLSYRVNDSIFSCFENQSRISTAPEELSSDIELYVRYRMKAGPERLKRTLNEDVIKRLVSRADGMQV
jgi:hypothetical protein